MLSVLLIVTLTLNADPKSLTYTEACNKAIKEGKELFVWRGVKDDYLVNKHKNAIHIFDPDLSKVKHDFPRVGVIVASPYTKTDLKIDIQTSQIGELADKLASKSLLPRESVGPLTASPKSQPLTKKRVISGGLYYDLYSNGQMIPCTACNAGR